MRSFFAVVVLSGAAFAPVSTAYLRSQQLAGVKPAVKSDSFSGQLGALPPAPSGESTILGGQIRDVDPVRDRFVLRMYGERPMKIVFDERTQVYLDGKKIPLDGLGPEDHASVQTTLDGTRVFALSIHILSPSPEGDYQGRVLRFDGGTGELSISAGLSSRPFTVMVPPNATITRTGQPSFVAAGSGPSDLAPGALVSVHFASGYDGQGVAKRITILAVPGSSFIFSGNIVSLDVSTGSLSVVDPRNQKSYQISFDPAIFPVSQNLLIGSHIRVVASYDGARYTASQISAR